MRTLGVGPALRRARRDNVLARRRRRRLDGDGALDLLAGARVGLGDLLAQPLEARIGLGQRRLGPRQPRLCLRQPVLGFHEAAFRLIQAQPHALEVAIRGIDALLEAVHRRRQSAHLLAQRPPLALQCTDPLRHLVNGHRRWVSGDQDRGQDGGRRETGPGHGVAEPCDQHVVVGTSRVGADRREPVPEDEQAHDEGTQGTGENADDEHWILQAPVIPLYQRCR